MIFNKTILTAATLLAGTVLLSAQPYGGGRGVNQGYGQRGQFAPQAQGECGPGMRGQGMRKQGPQQSRGPRFLSILRQLDLSQEQRSEVREILQSHRETARDHRATMGAHHLAIAELSRANPIDTAAIEAKVAEMAPDMVAGILQRATVRNEVLAVLSDEQYAKFIEIEQQRLARAADRLEDFEDDLPEPPMPPRAPRAPRGY